MERRSRGIDEIIQNAMQEGAFDNLPGKGKPLKLQKNPYIDSEWELAYHLLQENGFAPDFIERRKAIEMELAAAREMLARAWQWRGRALAAGEQANWVESEWGRVKFKFEEMVLKLNKEIRTYNLSTPAASFHRKLINVAAEIINVQAGE